MGNHVTHSWAYRFKEYVHSGSGKHEHYCTQCGGFKTEYCTYNSNNVCTKCGTPVGVSPDGIPSLPDALLPNTDEERKLKLSLLI